MGWSATTAGGVSPRSLLVAGYPVSGETPQHVAPPASVPQFAHCVAQQDGTRTTEPRPTGAAYATPRVTESTRARSVVDLPVRIDSKKRLARPLPERKLPHGRGRLHVPAIAPIPAMISDRRALRDAACARRPSRRSPTSTVAGTPRRSPRSRRARGDGAASGPHRSAPPAARAPAGRRAPRHGRSL